jgi:hypothetical protein
VSGAIALPSRETVAVFSRWTGAALRGVSFLVFIVNDLLFVLSFFLSLNNIRLVLPLHKVTQLSMAFFI